MKEIEVALDFEPNEKQQDALDKVKNVRLSNVYLDRCDGKTALAVYYLITEAMTDTTGKFNGMYVGSSFRACKQNAWYMFIEMLEPLLKKGLVSFNVARLQIRFDNGSAIHLTSMEQPEYKGDFPSNSCVALDEDGRYFEALRLRVKMDKTIRGLIIH